LVTVTPPLCHAAVRHNRAKKFSRDPMNKFATTGQPIKIMAILKV